MNINKFKRNLSSTHQSILMKKAPLFISSVFIVVLAIMPAPVHAAPGDKADSLIEDVRDIADEARKQSGWARERAKEAKEKIIALPTTVQTALNINLEQDLISDVKQALLDLTDTLSVRRDSIGSFEGDQCEDFKGQLVSLFTGLITIKTNMSHLGNPYIPDLADELGIITEFLGQDGTMGCSALYPIYYVFEELDADGLIEELGETLDALKLLAGIFLPDDTSGTACGVSNDDTIPDVWWQPGDAVNYCGEFLHSDRCEFMVNNDKALGQFSKLLKTISIKLSAKAKALDPDTITGTDLLRKLIPTPDSIDGGIHGYAHITLELPDGGKGFSNGLGFIAKKMGEIADWTKGEISSCQVSHNQFLVYEQQLTITEQANEIEALKAGQEKIIQLLLTPQGRRESEFCHPTEGEDCTYQSWGNTN
jgi:hypothetical protein